MSLMIIMKNTAKGMVGLKSVNTGLLKKLNG